MVGIYVVGFSACKEGRSTVCNYGGEAPRPPPELLVCMDTQPSAVLPPAPTRLIRRDPV